MKRRDLLRAGALAGGGLLLPGKWAFGKGGGRGARPVLPLVNGMSPGLQKFIQPLPGLGPTGIPVASPTADPNPIPNLAYDYYNMEMGEYTQSFHPDLAPSRLWGYRDAAHLGNGGFRYLGGVVVAKKGRPVKMTFTNNLPGTHPLPVDTSILGANLGVDRACVHLHGGLVPWTVDGGPWAWFRANGEKGISFMNPGPTPNSADYFYPNDQSARLVWYHDHAVGITRLNAYAGLASAYIIRDPFEQLLIQTGIIPQAEIPLIIQDKTFKTESDDYGNPGDLHYTISYDPNAFELAPPANPPVPSCVPEFFADTILVNGAAYPFVDVEPRRYRFRILNGANARFFNLQLYYAQNGNETEANLAAPGPAFIQFGTEGGFLPQPVVLNAPPKMMAFDPVTGNATAYTLLLAPAERADVIIDFSNVPVGSKLILWNDSPAPFPAGDPSISNPGTGPDTSTLLQFRVVPRTGARDRFDFNRTLLALKFALAPFALQKLPPAFAAGVRDLTLNEDFDEFGRLRQLIGTNVKIDPNAASYGRAYADLATEVVKKGSIEVWRIANLSGDTHPIHFHLVNVQILSRQPFDAVNYNGTPLYTGPKTLPDPNERGWKETVRMNPGEVITCIMKFDLAKVPFPVPMSPRTGGHEYVYHCHILEHEEHDMMRPLVVK